MANIEGDFKMTDRVQEALAASSRPSREGRRKEKTGPVLVAVDFSWHSRAALLWASRHAPNGSAPMTILHVLHDPPEAPGMYSRKETDPLIPLTQKAEGMMSEFMAELCDNHPDLKPLIESHTRIVEGLPAQTIVDQAQRMQASLIVVGSRGRTNLTRLMYGSIAMEVVKLSPLPVTVVKDQR